MLIDYKNSESSFIIAEVGQNHQGSVDKALEYINIFASMGADAVKFQTRNNKVLFDKKAYTKEYNSENAFAETYGEHREILELPLESLKDLKAECRRCNVKFMSTPFDEPSLQALMEVGVDLIKIASFDAGNIPFLKKIGATQLPVVMSCGGADLSVVKASVNALVESGTQDLAILHCISEYPSKFDILSLDKVKELEAIFKDQIVGLSDHFNGILSGPLGYIAGARIFEKHVTLDRSQKGTDHSFALEPGGFRRFVRDIRRTPEMMKVRVKEDLGDEAVFKKLGKSLFYQSDLDAGKRITVEDLSSKIFSEHGIPVRESKNIIGATLSKSVKSGDKCNFEDFILNDSENVNI